MNGSISLPSIEELKEQARRMRIRHAANGEPINHAKALEVLSHQQGYKDWNSLHAAIKKYLADCPVSMGESVRGTYLGHPFDAKVAGIRVLHPRDQFRVSLVFEEAVDVVKFDHMSGLRKNVSCTIGVNGKTLEKTSNGEPQLVLTLVG